MHPKCRRICFAIFVFLLAMFAAPAHAAQPNWTTVNNQIVRSMPKLVRDNNVLCLATNIYFEARGSSYQDQLAVANVTMNRMRANVRATSVCQIVWEKQQFSWTISPGRIRDREAWDEAQVTALFVYRGLVRDNTNGATHFHTRAVNPSWSRGVKPIRVIGSHRYYRLAMVDRNVRIASAAWRMT